MAIINGINFNATWLGFPVAVAGAAASVTLTNAYVQNTSGDAVAIRYLSRSTDTIDAVWVYVTAVSGSPVLAATLIAEQAGQPTRPATAATLDTSTAASTPGAAAWCKITFGTPYTPTVGEILWIVVHKTSGTTCDIRTGTNMAIQLGAPYQNVGYSSANGYTTNGTVQTEIPHLVKQGANYFGQPFTTCSGTAYTNNQLERGIKLVVPAACKVCGFVNASSTTSFANLVLHSSSGVPGGAGIATYDLDSDAGETTGDLIQAKIFDADQTLTQGSTYYLTLTYTVNSQVPLVYSIEDYASYQTEFDAIRDANPHIPIGVIDNGAGGWTENKAICPGIMLLVSDYPAGGGGIKLAGRGGLAG